MNKLKNVLVYSMILFWVLKVDISSPSGSYELAAVKTFKQEDSCYNKLSEFVNWATKSKLKVNVGTCAYSDDFLPQYMTEVGRLISDNSY